MSIWTRDIFTLDNLWHSLGGAFMAGLIAEGFWHPWTLTISVPVTFFAWGYIREVAQSENDWSSPIERPHKLWEAAFWGVGAWVATTALFVVWRLTG